MHYALESNVTLVDDMWSMDDGWWVKEGSLKAKNVMSWQQIPLLAPPIQPTR